MLSVAEYFRRALLGQIEILPGHCFVSSGSEKGHFGLSVSTYMLNINMLILKAM